MPVQREEQRLGAFSLVASVRRMLRLAGTNRKLLAVLVLLSMLQAGLELALPLVVRQGLDRHLLPAYVRIDPAGAGDWVEGDRARLIPAGDGRAFFIRRAELTETERHTLQVRKVLTHEGWFYLPRGAGSGGGQFVSDRDLDRLPAAERVMLRAEDTRGMLLLGGLYLLLLVLNFGLNYWVTVGLNFLGQRAVLLVRNRLWRKLLRLPVQVFNENPVGRLVTRVTNDTANLSDLFSSVLASAASDLALFAGILTTLLLLDVRTTLWLLALAPPIVALAWFFKRASQALYRLVRVQLAQLNTFLQESVTGLPIIRSFVREREFGARFLALNRDYYKTQMRVSYLLAIFRPFIDAFATIAAALVIWVAGGEVIRQELSIGTLVAFLLYLKMLFMPLQDLTEKFNILQSSVVSGERLFGLLDTPDEPSGAAATSAKGPADIVFENVTFGYEASAPVIRDVSFSLPAGKKVALVGPTGSGKTTLVSLLLKFFPLAPAGGQIRVGGVPIERWDTEALRRQFAIVQQDLFLFSGTLGDNLTLFGPADPARLAQALSTSRLDRILARLPKGLAHELNERGAVLSQGERQLASFARALAVGGPILILDEATASVDSATEALIQAALADLLRDRTALLIAHRLSTVQNADLILVLNKGRIVERGTHQELLALNGLYTHLYRSQLLERDQPDSSIPQ